MAHNTLTCSTILFILNYYKKVTIINLYSQSKNQNKNRSFRNIVLEYMHVWSQPH